MCRIRTRYTPIMNDYSRRSFSNVFVFILLLSMLGITLLFLFSFSRLQTLSTVTDVSHPYEHVEVWDFRGDDTVQFTTLDIYTESLKRSKWFSLPLIWSDTDIAASTPLNGTVIEQHAQDYDYRGQTYRSHSYIIESDQHQFGYLATFKVLPHVHVTGTATRLLSIGMDPSDEASIQTKFVLAVLLPDGVHDITVTDMQPYKTLMYNNTRALYYYDIHSITAHQSIHIAYTLTGIPTTDIDLSTVINSSNP